MNALEKVNAWNPYKTPWQDEWSRNPDSAPQWLEFVNGNIEYPHMNDQEAGGAGAGVAGYLGKGSMYYERARAALPGAADYIYEIVPDVGYRVQGIDANGLPIPGAQTIVQHDSDNTFWNAALAAGALAGGAAYGAAGGGGMTAAQASAMNPEMYGLATQTGLGGGTAAGLGGAAGGMGISAPAYGAGLGAETAAGLTAPGAAGGGAGLVGGMGGGASMGGGFLNALTSPNGLANLGSAAIGLYGQNKALDAYGDATAQANEFQRYAFDTIRGDNKPLLDLRNSVLPQIQSLLSNPGSITSQPDYQFQFNEGQKALNNGAAARGMTYSGAQGKALQKWGQDYGATKLDQSLNRLTNVAGMGQVAAANNNQATQNYGNNAANNALNLGNARGSAYTGMAGGVNNALMNVFDQNQWRNMWGNGS